MHSRAATLWRATAVVMRRRAVNRQRATAAAICVVCSVATLLVLSSQTAQAQTYNPRAPGFILHFQAGFNWSTRTDVSPPPDNSTYEARRSTALSLRGTYVLAQTPVAAFLELASAQRGASLQQTDGPTDQIRSRYFDLGGGLNFALRCVAGICPSLEAGGTLGLHRETVRVSGVTGGPVGVIPANRWETSALGGVRFAAQRFRGVAVTLRRVEGLSQLPTDESTARHRSTLLLFSVPLGR